MVPPIPRLPVGPRDIGVFVAIALALGWIAGNPSATYEIVFDQPPPTAVALTLFAIFALSPLIAVAVLVRRLRVGDGLRAFLRERFRWRTDVRWYVVATGLFPALAAVTYLVVSTVVEPVPVDPYIAGLILLEVVTLGIFFNLVENYGWRGFLQEALQSRVSAVAAAIVVGVVWGLWHAALFLPGGQFEAIPVSSYALVIVGQSVVIGWLYNSTRGSVLLAAIMHTSFNASFGVLITSLILADASVDALYAVTAVAVWSTVAVIAYRTDPSTLQRRVAGSSG
ncbi:CPBP family intramembrane glutamic endopeptidase [Natrononativus amylolyticus]|uniref:CPBP family intramembrane glutamic endopeptidase n=1 Tax=Natrononativus amylolyticus TaxID=2963434 RepID=UPI0020CD7E7D|nr:CPBP family intramembrane glutamic endopeptidase [Natrononativus amylolyticus]